MKEVNAILTIAYRDLTKLLRDRARILATFIFPFLFVGILGTSLDANVGPSLGYNLMVYVFTGVLGQTLFQSTASGIISLIEDRANDFSQEIFVAPISRYSIIFGKILGETLVALMQLIGITVFGLIVGVPFTVSQLLLLGPVMIACCLFGGAFGVMVLSNLGSERTANQIFPFIIFPQYFLSGIFSPVQNLPFFLDILSRLSPMRYAVDLVRGVYYWGTPEYSKTVLASPFYNLVIMGIAFFIFMVIGTYMFVRNERNR
jgi:ABC-2 type transport system permease protein